MSLWPFGKKSKDKEAVASEAKEESQQYSEEKQSEAVEAAVAPEQVQVTDQEAKISEKTEEAEEAETQTEEQSAGWLSRLSKGLGKSSTKLGTGLKQIFTARKLDDEMLEELEDLLISSDFGVKTAGEIVVDLAKNKYDKEITDEEVKAVLAEHISKKLTPVTKPLEFKPNKNPHVILFCGVNGAGKTTTIGKFANQFIKDGHKVVVAAGDTYRAAAVEQLAEWAKRSGCGFVKGQENADPASVAYTALEQAKKEKADLLLIDTAGRLQNKTNLMEQLAKVVRVIKKLDESAPHDAIIVLDATTGQNAHSQVKTFREMIGLSGMIITKLDGTAKGGVVVGLASEYQLPIHAIGVGESIEDLRAFEAESFAKSLVG